MPIVSSVLTQDESAQRDGRYRVYEVHTDHLGFLYTFSWLSDANTNANAVMAARVVTLLESLKDREINSNVSEILANGSLATPVLNYSTAAENFSVLRSIYQTASKNEAIMIADFLSSLSDTVLRNAFNMTAGQVTTLRTNKLTPAASLATSIRATTGA
jgi:hypothetical protein